MRAGHGIGTKHDLEIGRTNGPLEHLCRDRDRLFHRGKTGLVVIPDSFVLGPIVEIVAEDQTDLGVEEDPAIRHQLENFVIGEDAVLDLAAAGEYRRLDAFRAVSVYEST